jgi:hypothetical protein|tara:strand:+ start:700 stop:834 length:135 start_codon:yes stop_codon:yes gene_type:complete
VTNLVGWAVDGVEGVAALDQGYEVRSQFGEFSDALADVLELRVE